MSAHLRITFRQPEPGRIAVARDELIEVLGEDGAVLADISDSVASLRVMNKPGEARVVEMDLLRCQFAVETLERET